MSRRSPLERFKYRLKEFAKGERRGIRNPFVIVPVDPPFEYQAARQLSTWARQLSSSPNGIDSSVIWLDELFPRTDVFKMVLKLANVSNDKESIEKTLQDNLSEELVTLILEEKLKDDEHEHILLLLKLGSIYPFSHASELLDELDRRKVKSTIGILFPGEIFAGKLSLFGKHARHYYPAHRIDNQITEAHL